MNLQKATDTDGSKYMLRYFDVNFIFKNKLLTKIYSASGRQIIPCVTQIISLLFIIAVVNQLSLMILKIRIENESGGMNVKGNLSFEST